MKTLTIDPAQVDLREMIDRGTKLHGHMGPFLVVGIRMGLHALSLLESSGYFGIHATSQAGSKTPLSCLNDGIQIGSGCTAGKGNLLIVNGGIPSATFTCAGKTLSIELRERVVNTFPGSDLIAKSEELAILPAKELFTWTLLPSD